MYKPEVSLQWQEPYLWIRGWRKDRLETLSVWNAAPPCWKDIWNSVPFKTIKPKAHHQTIPQAPHLHGFAWEDALCICPGCWEGGTQLLPTWEGENKTPPLSSCQLQPSWSSSPLEPLRAVKSHRDTWKSPAPLHRKNFSPALGKEGVEIALLYHNSWPAETEPHFSPLLPLLRRVWGSGDATAGALHAIFTLLLMTLQGLAWPSPYASRLCLLAAAATGAKWDSFH